MLCDSPESTEPSRKMVTAMMSMRFLPKRSESLPYRGVVTALASRYAVTTQESSFSALKSLAIFGSAVETMVWSSAARSMVSMRAPIMTQRLRLSALGAGGCI